MVKKWIILLYNKKILILGFGRIGKALAKRCLGFEMQVYVYDPFLSEEEINKYNCIVVCVSKDSIESHQKFKKKIN